jgi:hypothetical protein
MTTPPSGAWLPAKPDRPTLRWLEHPDAGWTWALGVPIVRGNDCLWLQVAVRSWQDGLGAIDAFWRMERQLRGSQEAP